MSNLKDNSNNKKLPFRKVLQSVLAAAFGVQQQRNYQRDFSLGKPHSFIIAGITGTVLFVLFLAGLAQLILFLSQK